MYDLYSDPTDISGAQDDAQMEMKPTADPREDLPLPAPEATSISWLGPACTASAWVKRGLARQSVNRSRPRQSNKIVTRARRKRLVAW